ncbi:MAG TPA: hypothetical protein VJ672_13570 [Gemmatimonadaceae bacterium]|nr:hypothetical protein [Gemmatimonadaceae bacterium]
MTNRSPGRIGLPPPAAWNLVDGDRLVGWTRDTRIGFRGFADQTEAVHAAWVAYRTLARRLARTHGMSPVPIDSARLGVHHNEERQSIVAGQSVIGTLFRPGDESPTGSESFAFEVVLPHDADELEVRALAYLMYRALRKSGLRWALWRPGTRLGSASAVAQNPDSERAIASTIAATRRLIPSPVAATQSTHGRWSRSHLQRFRSRMTGRGD